MHEDDVARVKAELDEHSERTLANFESEHRVRHEDGPISLGAGTRHGRPRRPGPANPHRRFADRHHRRQGGRCADGSSESRAVHGPTRTAHRVRARKPELNFALLFLDLDRFKNINDSLGHHAGDLLLGQTARRLEQCLRASDTVGRLQANEAWHTRVGNSTVARLGGDEFAVLLTGLQQPADATLTADRIGRVLATPFTIEGQDVFTSASIGIALSSAGYTKGAELLRDADTALYRAKVKGRGTFEVFDHAMRRQAIERLQLETELRRAIERERIHRPLSADRLARHRGHQRGRGSCFDGSTPDEGSSRPRTSFRC